MNTVSSCLIFSLGVFAISTKSDIVLSHIKALEPGVKVSVREIASFLQISEGTAYKAIKEAERMGLVVIRPKSGTVRAGNEKKDLSESLSIREMGQLVGVSYVTGRENADLSISRIAICDGSEQDLLYQLNEVEPQRCLCLCGNRPELQAFVLEHGANLLLTSGSKPDWQLQQNAEKAGLYLLTSPQSSYSILRQLFSLPGGAQVVVKALASDWMQAPDYLYYNDITTDWQQAYLKSSLPKQYPLVDENLEIYGALDLWKATSGIPFQKLGTMLASQDNLVRVNAGDNLENAARRLILSGKCFAAVMDGSRMIGLLNSNDLLRYYLFAGSGNTQHPSSSFLVPDESLSGGELMVFKLQIPNSALCDIANLEMDLILAAAGIHLQQAGCKTYSFSSGTFFSLKEICKPGDLILSSRLQHNEENAYMSEIELTDNNVSYAKAVLIAKSSSK